MDPDLSILVYKDPPTEFPSSPLLYTAMDGYLTRTETIGLYLQKLFVTICFHLHSCRRTLEKFNRVKRN